MVPGIITLWHSTIASIPAGWHHCDGTEGTPDLRNKFSICASEDDAGVAKATIEGVLKQSGGVADHTHTLAAGDKVIDQTPGGSFNSVTVARYNYPPCFSLVYMMKL